MAKKIQGDKKAEKQLHESFDRLEELLRFKTLVTKSAHRKPRRRQRKH
jgi:hypothetical protein